MSTLGPSDHEPSALLSDETLSAVELRAQPFLRPEVPADTFTDEVTTDQLSDIKQALITGDDLLLILGESGVGKSTLLSQLADNSGLRIQCFSVHGSARFTAVNLFGGMLEAFKREPPDNLKTMLDELVPCLQGMISNNTLSAVVIDDADAVDAIELTRLLSAMLYMNSQDETLMRIALSAPPEFEERIPELLPEGADLPYSTLTIEPFEHERAAHYLAWRFERAGEAPGIPFDEAQIVDMNSRAEGNPRRLHEIAADELNALHGELEPAIPPELLTSSRGESASIGAAVLGGRSAKMLFGGLGVLLIGLGLLLFLPGGDEQDDSFAVVEQRKLDEQNADRLALVDEDTPTPGASGVSTDEASRVDALNSEPPSTDPTIANREVPGEQGLQTDGASTAATTLAESTDQAQSTINETTRDAITIVEESSSASSNAGSAPAEVAESLEEALDSVADAGSEALRPTNEQNDTADDADESASDVSSATDSLETDDVPVADPDQSAGDEADASETTIADSEPVDAPVPASQESDAGAEPTDAAQISDAEDIPTTSRDPAEPEVAESTPAADPSPVSDPSSPASNDGMESPNWILTQNPDLYTIQMIASTSRREVEVFLVDANLRGPNSIFTFQRGGVDWYALVHGLYESVEDARSAIIRMPDAALSFQPWIRSIGRVQNSLRK